MQPETQPEASHPTTSPDSDEQPAPDLAAAAGLSVVLVRHADVVGDGPDPSLSPAGRARARLLARMLADAPVAGVYVTGFRRSQQTGERTALAANLTATQYDALDAATLASTITAQHPSGVVLVVAHSNTVDDIGAALGVGGVGELAEKEFDRMFILVRLLGGTVLLRLRYGAIAH